MNQGNKMNRDSELDTVFNHFLKGLGQPFRISNSISVHLDEKILEDLTIRWPTISNDQTKAGFLMSLLGTKRITDQMKPVAEQVFGN
jgi:hypothetical protein